MELLIGLHSVS